MKEWRYATQKEIDNMTFEEASTIIQKHIDMGKEAMINSDNKTWAPRAHFTKALEITLEMARQYARKSH